MTVSARSTKATLLKEVERLQSQLQETRATALRPAEMKKQKRKKEVMAKTEGLSLDGVKKSVGTLAGRVQAALQDIETSLEEKVQELATVDESLNFKKEELQEVFGIETKAETLAALLEAQAERKETFEKEMTEKKQAFDEEQARLRKAWLEEKQEHQRLAALEAQRDQERRERETEEAAYNFSRQEREKLDALSDQLSQQRKAFVEQMDNENKLLAERAEDVAKRELAVNELEEKVVQLETRLVTDVEAAVEKAKKGAQTSKAIAESALRKDYDAQITVLNGKLESAQDQLSAAQSRVVSLESDLAAARAEVNQVALRALDAQSGKAALAAVQEATRDQGKK